jgi:hypothetical protein
MHKKSFLVDEVQKKTSKVDELIHANICGPMNVPSIEGSKYYVLFHDDYFGFRFVYCVATKSKAFWCFEKMFTIEFTKTLKIMLAHCEQIEVASFLKKNFKHFYSMKEFITSYYTIHIGA